MLVLFLISQLQQDTEVADILFQEDGALTHYHCRVTSFLDATFPNKWDGWGVPIRWLPQLPDLTPLGFHFCGYIKDRVYVPPLLQSLRELRDRIHDAAKSVFGVLHGIWGKIAFRWICVAWPIEATSSIYEQKLGYWATVVEQLISLYVTWIKSFNPFILCFNFLSFCIQLSCHLLH
jgi:hypothetical protein